MIYNFSWWILSFKIFTDSIIVSSTDCMGGPYEKELLKGLLTDYERYAFFFTQLSKRPLWQSGFYWFHLSNSFDSRQNRPVLNESSPLVLTFGVTLQQIIDVVGGTWKYFDWFNTFSGRKESAPDHLSMAQLGKEVLLIASVFAIKCTDQFCHDFHGTLIDRCTFTVS